MSATAPVVGSRAMSTLPSPTPASSRFARLRQQTQALRQRLFSHPVYHSVQTLSELQVFTRFHVFAVWDFMSLLKWLQRRLTCVEVPWIPPANPQVARLINEIVLGEETDLVGGQVQGHFDLYRQAMQELGASTAEVDRFLDLLRLGDVPQALHRGDLPEGARNFVATTFELLETDSPAQVAAAFTLGREDIIPTMFQSLVDHLGATHPGRLDRFRLYLQRHIEVDGEEHGPAAQAMIELLCGEDEDLWDQARQGAERALTARISLWDSVLGEL